MSRRKGDTHLALIQRRDNVRMLLIRHARLNEMVSALGVGEDTIQRDIEAVLEEWRSSVEIKAMWSHKASFDYLNELERHYWQIFQRKPQPILIGKKIITPDNSGLQVDILDSLHATVKTKNIMAGIGTAKIFESLRYIEGERARGFQYTKMIGYEDAMKEGVKKLRSDLEAQRREGLITDEPITTT